MAEESMEDTFARRFAEVWRAPTTEALVGMLHPEIVLYQPHQPEIRGKVAVHEEFERTFRWLPGLHGKVVRTLGANGVLFIEWEMHFELAGKPLCVGAVDRFLLKDGLAIERAVYFNDLQIMASVATHPSSWLDFLRYHLGQ